MGMKKKKEKLDIEKTNSDKSPKIDFKVMLKMLSFAVVLAVSIWFGYNHAKQVEEDKKSAEIQAYNYRERDINKALDAFIGDLINYQNFDWIMVYEEIGEGIERWAITPTKDGSGEMVYELKENKLYRDKEVILEGVSKLTYVEDEEKGEITVRIETTDDHSLAHVVETALTKASEE